MPYSRFVQYIDEMPGYGRISSHGARSIGSGGFGSSLSARLLGKFVCSLSFFVGLLGSCGLRFGLSLSTSRNATKNHLNHELHSGAEVWRCEHKDKKWQEKHVRQEGQQTRGAILLRHGDIHCRCGQRKLTNQGDNKEGFTDRAEPVRGNRRTALVFFSEDQGGTLEPIASILSHAPKRMQHMSPFARRVSGELRAVPMNGINALVECRTFEAPERRSGAGGDGACVDGAFVDEACVTLRLSARRESDERRFHAINRKEGLVLNIIHGCDDRKNRRSKCGGAMLLSSKLCLREENGLWFVVIAAREIERASVLDQFPSFPVAIFSPGF